MSDEAEAPDVRLIQLPFGSAPEPWEAVLAAAAIPYQAQRRSGRWGLLVQRADADYALELLRAVEAEPSGETGRLPEPTAFPGSLGGVPLAAVWLGVAILAGLRGGRSAWFEVGSADAARVVGGEWWRVVTALTLHADPAHLLSNVFATAVLGTALGRVVGPGTATLAMLASGGAGNALNAWMYGVHHHSVGASTAVFGVVGTLAGLSAIDVHGRRRARRGAWLPLAAGLGLLAFFGTADGTDLGAHLFGFLAGVAAGGGLGIVRLWLPGPRWQALLSAVGVTSVAAAWWWAWASR